VTVDAVVTWLGQSTLLAENPNWAVLVVVLVLAASAYVGATKTPTDDARFAKWVQFLSVLVPKDAPGTLKWLLTVVAKPVDAKQPPAPEPADEEDTKP
jgi:hypothetical protein